MDKRAIVIHFILKVQIFCSAERVLSKLSNNQKKFADKWKRHGIDISKGKVHVRRAGNINMPTPEAKAKVVSDAIKTSGHKTVHLYDDHKANIDAVLALKKKHPDVEFHGHHVQHGADGKITVTHYKA